MDALANRLRLLRALGPAGLPVNAALVVVMLVERLGPAVMAAGVGLVVGGLGEAIGSGSLSAAVAPLCVFGGAVLATQAAEALLEPLKFIAAVRIDGPHRERVARTAASSGRVEVLERPETQRLIREAMADRSHGYDCTPSDGAVGQLRWAAGMVGAAAACAVLAQYAWWFVPMALIPAALHRVLRTRDDFALAARWRAASKDEQHADVWREATTSQGEGKDIRVFGLADWSVTRMQGHIRAANAPLWSYIDRMLRRSGVHLMLVIVGLLPMYVMVASGAPGRADPAALAAAVFAAGWSLFLVLGPDSEMYNIIGAGRVLRAHDELRDALGESEPSSATARAAESSDRPAGGDRPAPPRVCFADVSFRYPGDDQDVLDGLNLEIEPGEFLAVVGINGAGKSTLIKLLTGLYEPTSGVIRADGHPLSQTPATDWRRRLSVVFQDFVKYPLSAEDNVALGHGHTPRDRGEVERAAHEAGFEAVIERLPDGWDTPLSRTRSGGVDLSGGQWQQTVLARALYAMRRGARLLVLDEPTAHLDVRTESDVFERLAKSRGDSGLVLISHRLSTVRQADRIVFLDGGRITESGTHDELMAKGGAYADMFRIQAARFRRGYDDRIEEGDVL
ncbi:ABC transporter ATP-binding protein [Streptomyces sedi]|uniref:ATP-binding cassette domain-containing protein n=1 Tax=Streptomyces sedi TaxID=555059 RepID=A0A5C4UQE1_9ACTN|nr:ATP-binding cassette domain-containing protein [Streptomyces sedi]TNM25854.1 ATP-binding cassette domain-containing protein [Streptomyces sedi]